MTNGRPRIRNAFSPRTTSTLWQPHAIKRAFGAIDTRPRTGNPLTLALPVRGEGMASLGSDGSAEDHFFLICRYIEIGTRPELVSKVT
jgi:hypothetical protein